MLDPAESPVIEDPDKHVDGKGRSTSDTEVNYVDCMEDQYAPAAASSDEETGSESSSETGGGTCGNTLT